MARERPRKMPSDNDAKLNRNGGKAKADISIYGQESNYLVIALRRLNRGVFAVTPAEQTPIQTAQGAFQSLLPDLWGPAAQARATVWGLPMIVFALIAAITER